jgi:16S rRNA (cytidine1402-2'-O)-methyltransferase|tara:strand:+ start:1294 stop:2136 length:843 start_codon:yes stop_codon:yes gene_type:complete
MSGTLFVVATPIGNLGDITQRGIDVLKQVNVIAAEDTRRSRVLVQHIGHHSCEILSLHEHNEDRVSPLLVRRLVAGEDVALISDAGTPLLNDPGYPLLVQAWEAGVQVVPIPGASSITAALSVCPLPSQPFRYVGFLPSKASQRSQALERWLAQPEALVFLEAPHRIRAAVEDLAELTTRRLMLGREMTKRHETYYCGTPQSILNQLADDPRGEFVVIVEASDDLSMDVAADHVLSVLIKELAPAQAARLTAQICGIRKKEAYRLALQRTPDASTDEAPD